MALAAVRSKMMVLLFVFLFVCLFFYLFNTLFSLSSDIQEVGEGDPLHALKTPNMYFAGKLQRLLAPFIHLLCIFESNYDTVVHNHKGASKKL